MSVVSCSEKKPHTPPKEKKTNQTKKNHTGRIFKTYIAGVKKTLSMEVIDCLLFRIMRLVTVSSNTFRYLRSEEHLH